MRLPKECKKKRDYLLYIKMQVKAVSYTDSDSILIYFNFQTRSLIIGMTHFLPQSLAHFRLLQIKHTITCLPSVVNTPFWFALHTQRKDLFLLCSRSPAQTMARVNLHLETEAPRSLPKWTLQRKHEWKTQISLQVSTAYLGPAAPVHRICWVWWHRLSSEWEALKQDCR